MDEIYVMIVAQNSMNNFEFYVQIDPHTPRGSIVTPEFYLILAGNSSTS